MTLLEMAQASPGFKAFCRRRINGKSKTMAQILADNRKKTLADMKAFMKRRGPLSILKENEYLTACGDDLVRAQIIRTKDGNFTSVVIYDSRKENIPDEAA